MLWYALYQIFAPTDNEQRCVNEWFALIGGKGQCSYKRLVRIYI